MTLFEDLKIKIESNNNSNYHFDKLDGATQVWIAGLCSLLEHIKSENVAACDCEDGPYPGSITYCVACGKDLE